MRSGVCGYLCLMERLIEEKPEAHSGAPIGSQESADPDTSTLNIYLSFAPILPPCLFFFSSSSSSLLSAHLSHLFSPSLPSLRLLSIFWRYFLPPPSLHFSLFLSSPSPLLSPPPYLSIFPRHFLLPPPLLSSPSLYPLSQWLSFSDRLLMQAVYDSISPSAVVELASLLSRQDLFISLPTSACVSV